MSGSLAVNAANESIGAGDGTTHSAPTAPQEAAQEAAQALEASGAVISSNDATGVASFVRLGASTVRFAGSQEAQAQQFLNQYGAERIDYFTMW